MIIICHVSDHDDQIHDRLRVVLLFLKNQSRCLFTYYISIIMKMFCSYRVFIYADDISILTAPNSKMLASSFASGFLAFSANGKHLMNYHSILRKRNKCCFTHGIRNLTVLT